MLIYLVNVIILIAAILGGVHIAATSKPLKLCLQAFLAGIFVHVFDISYNIYNEICEYNMDGIAGLFQLDACLGATERLSNLYHIWVGQALILASIISLPLIFITYKRESRDRAG